MCLHRRVKAYVLCFVNTTSVHVFESVEFGIYQPSFVQLYRVFVLAFSIVAFSILAFALFKSISIDVEHQHVFLFWVESEQQHQQYHVSK